MTRLFDVPNFNSFESMFDTITNVMSTPKSIVDKQEDGYKVIMSVPGLTKEDFKITVKDRKITISFENQKKPDQYTFVSTFTKSYFLSDDVIEKKIEAEVKNGILVISLPIKDIESKEKVVDIK